MSYSWYGAEDSLMRSRSSLDIVYQVYLVPLTLNFMFHGFLFLSCRCCVVSTTHRCCPCSFRSEWIDPWRETDPRVAMEERIARP